MEAESPFAGSKLARYASSASVSSCCCFSAAVVGSGKLQAIVERQMLQDSSVEPAGWRYGKMPSSSKSDLKRYAGCGEEDIFGDGMSCCYVWWWVEVVCGVCFGCEA